MKSMYEVDESARGYTHDQLIAKIQWFYDHMNTWQHEMKTLIENKTICETEDDKEEMQRQKRVVDCFIESYCEVFEDVIEWRKL